MTKYLLIGLAVLALLAGGWGYTEHLRAGRAADAAATAQEARRNAESALTKANEQIALQQRTSLALRQELNGLRQQAAAQQKALNEALKANPDWADAPIPDGVYDALTGPLGAAGQAGPGLDRARAGAATARP